MNKPQKQLIIEPLPKSTSEVIEGHVAKTLKRIFKGTNRFLERYPETARHNQFQSRMRDLKALNENNFKSCDARYLMETIKDLKSWAKEKDILIV